MDNDTKKCPFCGEEIKITAKKCKHCKEFLPEIQSTASTKTCPYCGGEVAPTAKKCKHCGEWLVEEEVKRPSSVQGSKRCQFCGSIIPEYAERCPKCGEWLVREENSKQVKDGPGYIVDILAILVGFGLGSIGTNGTEMFWLCVIGFIGTELYLLPTKIALEKRHTQLFLVVVVNILLGETIIGWIIALAIASAQRKGRNSL